jgi:hypothetical protein
MNELYVISIILQKGKNAKKNETILKRQRNIYMYKMYFVYVNIHIKNNYTLCLIHMQKNGSLFFVLFLYFPKFLHKQKKHVNPDLKCITIDHKIHGSLLINIKTCEWLVILVMLNS